MIPQIEWGHFKAPVRENARAVRPQCAIMAYSINPSGSPDLAFELPREIHRCDVAVLVARFGLREWRERTGAAQDFERLTIEYVVA